LNNSDEIFISVDVESSGPIPGEYSLLSIGACVVGSSKDTFYKELVPTSSNFVPESLEVTGFTLKGLEKSGENPEIAMRQFADWVYLVSNGRTPVFVALNAPFDWSFINYYFYLFKCDNPFGFTALDIKALFMGLTGSNWKDTRSSKINEYFQISAVGDHNALNDAKAQAELFKMVLEKIHSGI